MKLNYSFDKYKIIFTLFVISYAILYSLDGFDDADRGYTLALSWRIFNGEIPYRDIILVRPPFSPLFHSIFLYFIPDNYEIIFDRYFCYFLFAASSLFGALSINKVFNLKSINLNPYLLATIGFVFSVHNYPAMGWHTIDAIFFASIGIYILVNNSTVYSVIFGILFLFFSGLCKQPFYLMSVLGILYVFLIHRNLRKTITAVFSLFFFIFIFVLILYQQEALQSFINLTTGSTNIKDLLNAGFKNYMNFSPIYLILPFGFWIITKKHLTIKNISIKENLAPYFLISILLGFEVLNFVYHLAYKDVNYSYSFSDSVAKLFFVITVFFLLENLSYKKEYITLWILISISWCASISWGYKTPVLFSTPLLFGFLLVSNHYFGLKKVNTLALYSLLLGTITYFIAYQKPYCNPIKQTLTYRIDDLFPKMKYINVSKETHDKYTEFYFLIKKYGTNYKTLPGMPLSNYLSNTKSPIKIDWVFNAETNNENQSIINELTAKKTIIFMEKNPQFIHIENSKEKFNSSIAYFIKKNWMKIDSTKYFEIYRLKN